MGDKTFKTASSTAGMVVDYENSALCGNQNNEEDFNEYLDMYENRAHNNLEEDDYYSLFRVSRNAKLEDIKFSYRKMSLMLHPDKHLDPEQKSLATIKYEKLKKAYDVLSDPMRRKIYDLYGAEAADRPIATSYNDLNFSKNVDEVEVDQYFGGDYTTVDTYNTKGNLTMMVNARKILNPNVKSIDKKIFHSHTNISNDRGKVWGRANSVALPSITNIIIDYRTKVLSTKSTSVSLIGYTSVKKSSPFGNLGVDVNYLLNKDTVIDVTSKLGSAPEIDGRIMRTISKSNFVIGSISMVGMNFEPTAEFTLGRRINNNMMGTIRLINRSKDLNFLRDYTLMPSTTCVLGLTKCKNKTRMNFDAKCGYYDTSIGGSYIYPIAYNFRAKFYADISSYYGFSTGLYCVRKLTNTVYAGLGIECSKFLGTFLSAKLSIGRQAVSVPVTLFNKINLKFLSIAASVYFVSIIALDKLFLKPRRRKTLNEKLQLIRSVNAELFKKKLDDCSNEQILMLGACQKSLERENNSGGLIILEALYGNEKKMEIDLSYFKNVISLKSIELKLDKTEKTVVKTYIMKTPDTTQQSIRKESSFYSDGVVDVTIPMQSLVLNSCITINKGISKSPMFGFMNPSLGDKKFLLVIYLYLSKLHFTKTSDDETSAIPMKSHIY